MASVAWKKLTSTSAIEAAFRHDDGKEREHRTHKNPDIDRTISAQNPDYVGGGYDACIKRYKDRIAEMDALPGANKRKDRVTAFELEIKSPAAWCTDNKAMHANAEEIDAWFRAVLTGMQKQYGTKNIISAYVHWDEIHQYYDPALKQNVWSRPHMQIVVVPEVNGKLCAFKFSARKNMKMLNGAIDNMSKKIFGVPFLTHEAPRHMTVEELKAASQDAVEGRAKQAAQLAAQLDDLNQQIATQKQTLDGKLMKVQLEAAQHNYLAIKRDYDRLTDTIAKIGRLPQYAGNPVVQKCLKQIRDRTQQNRFDAIR